MPVLLPTAKVLNLCHPLRQSPWDTDRVTKKMVREALQNEWFRDKPVGAGSPALSHASRIAFLVKHGWEDAIEVDVGIPSMGYHVNWSVTDGNHRLAAAAYRGDEAILASVAGSLDYALELFGVECEEPQH